MGIKQINYIKIIIIKIINFIFLIKWINNYYFKIIIENKSNIIIILKLLQGINQILLLF